MCLRYSPALHSRVRNLYSCDPNDGQVQRWALPDRWVRTPTWSPFFCVFVRCLSSATFCLTTRLFSVSAYPSVDAAFAHPVCPLHTARRWTTASVDSDWWSTHNAGGGTWRGNNTQLVSSIYSCLIYFCHRNTKEKRCGSDSHLFLRIAVGPLKAPWCWDTGWCCQGRFPTTEIQTFDLYSSSSSQIIMLSFATLLNFRHNRPTWMIPPSSAAPVEDAGWMTWPADCWTLPETDVVNYSER